MKTKPSTEKLEFSMQSTLISCFKTLIYVAATYGLFTIGGWLSYILLIPVGFYLLMEALVSVVSILAILVVLPIERASARRRQKTK